MAALVFDPNDPFPRFDVNTVSYRDQQLHSARVDDWLGLETEQVEAGLQKSYDGESARARNERYWIGLSVQSLLTPYVEIRFLLDELQVSTESVVDLGAGYGRIGFVLAKYFPRASFRGFEVVAERVAAGSEALVKFTSDLRLDRPPLLEVCDLTSQDFEMPTADIYFLYDYGSAAAIEKSLQDLRQLASTRSITVVGRGGATRDAIEKRHPWLSGVERPRHYPHFSIYRS